MDYEQSGRQIKMEERKFRAVVSFVDSLEEKKQIPGCSIQIVQHGKCVLTHCTGLADVEKQRKVEEDTLFRIFSMTKLITCTCAMQLYEQGRFDLNEPLYLYLPEYKKIKVFSEIEPDCKAVEEAKNPILIKDLFRMSAGFTYGGSGLPTEKQTQELLDRLDKSILQDEEEIQPMTTREVIMELSKIPLAFEPGTHWRYGMSHDVLGALIEEISGMKLEDYMKRFIFDPLDMKETGFYWEEKELEQRLAKVYSTKSGKQEEVKEADWYYRKGKNRYASGGSGLLSTLRDYMKFANTMALGGTNQDGVRLLGRKTLELMRMDHLSKEMKADYNWAHQAAYSYGLGCRTMVYPQKGGCNSSYGEFGWSGKAGSLVFIDPAEELAVVYMQQMMPSLEDYVMPRLRSVIYGCL